MSVLQVVRSHRDTAPEPAPDEAFVEREDGLEPIELYTVWGRELAWIGVGKDRTSDWLNHSDTLDLRGVTDLPFGGEPTEVPAPEGLPDAERLAADVVMVVPPPLPPNRHLRLHRRIEEVRMDLASFSLVGRVHIRPGSHAGDYLLRGNRRFVPITRVELSYRGEVEFRRQLPVVIVNVTHVTLLDRGADSAPPPGAAQPDPAAPTPAGDAGAEGTSGIETGTFLSVRAALEELAGLADAGLITAAEHRGKRAEILARL